MIASPLRYPGGKTKLAATIIDNFIGWPQKVVSPFIGGGSIELALAERGTRIVGFDTDTCLVGFWRELARLGFYEFFGAIDEDFVESYGYPVIDRDFFLKAKDELSFFDQKKLPERQRAERFFIVNRCSFSGLGMNGGYSLEAAKRLDSDFLEKIMESDPDRMINPESFKVEFSYFARVLEDPKYDGVLTYCDPPYVDKERLYGVGRFDHEELAELLHRRGNWVLSYGDCPEIRELYDGYPMYELSVNYCARLGANKPGHELIVTSQDRQPLGLF